MYNDDDKTDVNYNDTYLQNPDYPSVYSETNSLDYTVNCQNFIKIRALLFSEPNFNLTC